MADTLNTIGHSNRGLNEFFRMLHQAGVKRLIDVRSIPYSRRYPSYTKKTLQLACEDESIEYFWEGNHLGGMKRERPYSPHSALSDSSFRGYADYMNSNKFHEAINRLMALARTKPSVIMCAERDPNQCHRTLIADYLTLHHWHIIHLIDPNTQIGHSLHPLARIENDRPIYDQLNEEQLKLGL